MSNDYELKGQSSVAGTPVLTMRDGIIRIGHHTSLYKMHIVQRETISAVPEKFSF